MNTTWALDLCMSMCMGIPNEDVTLHMQGKNICRAVQSHFGQAAAAGSVLAF